MAKNTKAAGDRRERQVKDLLIGAGYEVKKARVSLGAADLVCIKRNPGGGIAEKLLIQVKANKGSPYMNFRREERQELADEARLAGAQAWLIHWPPNGRMEIYPEDQWPGNLLNTPLTDLGL